MAKDEGWTRTLTPEQAAKAIYIDFEGRIDEPPALLGVLYAEGRKASPDRLVMRHEILDPGLRELVGRAVKQDRVIVSWSQHELGELSEAGLHDERLTNRFVDGKVTAKRWRRAIHPGVEFPFDTSGGANKLVRYLDLIDYELPATYGLGKVGTWLAQTREALSKRQSWADLTETQQARWSRLLEHNANDLVGLREVVTRAAGELGAMHPEE